MWRRFAPVTVVVAVALVLTPWSARAQDDLVKTLSSIEKSLWEGWKNREAEPFRKHLVENALTIGGWGVEAGKQKAIQMIESDVCDVESYSHSDWAVHRVADNVAILTYRATQNATCEGEKIPEKIVASSTYVQKDGIWMSASYHETPIEM